MLGPVAFHLFVNSKERARAADPFHHPFPRSNRHGVKLSESMERKAFALVPTRATVYPSGRFCPSSVQSLALLLLLRPISFCSTHEERRRRPITHSLKYALARSPVRSFLGPIPNTHLGEVEVGSVVMERRGGDWSVYVLDWGRGRYPNVRGAREEGSAEQGSKSSWQ